MCRQLLNGNDVFKKVFKTTVSCVIRDPVDMHKYCISAYFCIFIQ